MVASIFCVSSLYLRIYISSTYTVEVDFFSLELCRGKEILSERQEIPPGEFVLSRTVSLSKLFVREGHIFLSSTWHGVFLPRYHGINSYVWAKKFIWYNSEKLRVSLTLARDFVHAFQKTRTLSKNSFPACPVREIAFFRPQNIPLPEARKLSSGREKSQDSLEIVTEQHPKRLLLVSLSIFIRLL